MSRKSEVLKAVRDFIRQPYAWPGGYPLFLVMRDNEAMCKDCVKDNYRLISKATHEQDSSGWEAECVAVNWEDDDLTCSNCNHKIECTYSDN